MINIDKVFNFFRYYFIFIITWTVLSSFFDLVFFAIGNCVFIFFYFFAIRINFLSKSNEFFSIAFFKYLISLFISVFQSSKESIAIIFNESTKDKSGIKKINISSLNQEERVLFTNIITMAPGTFVISTNGDDYFIHSIDLESLENLNTEKIKDIILKTRKVHK